MDDNPVMEHRMLLNGKYKNHTFLHAASDRAYCSWVLGESHLPLSLKLFQRYLKQQHGGIFVVGKHKRRFFDEVLHSDPSYTSWIMGLEEPSPNLHHYKRYVLLYREVEFHSDGRDHRLKI